MHCVYCVCCVCQLESQQARSGGRSCDGGRRAALEVAEDTGVRVRPDAVLGGWGWRVVSDDGVLRWGGVVVVLSTG